VPTLHEEIGVGDKQNLWIPVTSEPPAVMGKRRRLNPQMRVPAFHDVLLHELESAVVFVDVVLFDGIRQATDDKEVSISKANSPCAMEEFLRFVSSKLFQGFGVVDVDP